MPLSSSSSREICKCLLHRLAPTLSFCHFHQNFFKFGFLRSEKKSARAQNDVIARSTTMETREANSKAHLARMCSNCSFYDRLCRMWKSRKLAFLRLRPLDGNGKTGLNSLSAKRPEMMTGLRGQLTIVVLWACGWPRFFGTAAAICGMPFKIDFKGQWNRCLFA